MPTTNVSQIISNVIGSVRFLRKEQRRFVEGNSVALFPSAHKNTSRLARFCSSSQSSISGMLSSQSLSTRDLSYARVDYISRFLQENSLEFKYIILVLILSEDGRPLTNNVVFIRVGRLCSKDGPAVTKDQGDLNNKSLCPGILIPKDD